MFWAMTVQRFDPERDEEQLVGHVPRWVVESLWPGFEPQNLEIWMNAVYLQRHMRRHPDYPDRVAALNQNADTLPEQLSAPAVYVRYDGVPKGDAGVTIYVEAKTLPQEPVAYLAVGVRLLAEKNCDGKPNHVTTIIPATNERRLRGRLKKMPHVIPEASSSELT